MKLAKYATKPLAILTGVLDHFKLEFRSRLFREVNPDWLGAFIEKKDFPAIAKIVDPDGKLVGWFGYHSGETASGKAGDPRLHVELYPHGSKSRKIAALKRIKRKLMDHGIHKTTESEWTLEVVCKHEDSPGDMEWFIKILTALCGDNRTQARRATDREDPDQGVWAGHRRADAY